MPIVTGLTAWDCPQTGDTFILVFHESLYYGMKLNHSLINPNQIRHNGIDYWDNPYDGQRGLNIDIDRGPIIEMALDGTKVSFSSRAPTRHELDTCEYIEMTSNLNWDPQNVKLGGNQRGSESSGYHWR